MAHVHRFYVEPEAAEETVAVLEGAEAHHALHVVRVQPGDAVVLFDGQGRELEGRVASATRHDLSVEITRERSVQPETHTLTLIQAALHREKSVEDLIRRCTELGVAGFVFFASERSERPPRMTEKWRRWAIESCKQCGRLWLPGFHIASSLEAALEGQWSALLTATASAPPVPIRSAAAGNRVALAVGPEGDFASGELEMMLARGALPISLGPMTFRSEVAATIASALVLYELGFLGPVAP